MPLRVGLIGFGLAGSAFHAPLVAAEPRLVLASVVTGDPERGEQVRARYPEARVLPDAEALWAMAADHDAIVVAAPNREHVPLGLAALEAGLHVVIDKPVAPTAASARLLGEAARQRGLVASAFHNRRWDGDALTLRRLLERDELGRVLRFESAFERWRPRVEGERWRERPDPEDAGGVLFDLGTHLVDQALWLFGPAEVVGAELRTERPGAQVDDDAFIVLLHDSGVRSHLRASLVTALPGPRMRVLGARRGWVKWGLDPQEAALRAGADPRAEGFGSEPPERFGRLGVEGAETVAVETERGRYLAFYEGFADAVISGARPPVPLADAAAGLELIEAARLIASARA
jgi:scyllo-inositol 2-dehydrogenase (NADP+)